MDFDDDLDWFDDDEVRSSRTVWLRLAAGIVALAMLLPVALVAVRIVAGLAGY